MFNRDSLKEVRKNFRTGEVTVGGQTVRLRTMSAGSKNRFEADNAMQKETSLRDMLPRLLVACICDEEGKLIFKDNETDLIADLPADFVEPIFKAAMKLNGYDKETTEETVKN